MAERQHDYHSAAEHTETYLKENPQDGDAWLDLGGYYLMMNQRENAIHAFQNALKVDPNSEQARQALDSLDASPQPDKK